MEEKAAYLILHKDRPYFLQLNVELLRYYYPALKLVVVDDNSDPKVVDKLKDTLKPYNVEFITNVKGACSDTIMKGREACNEYKWHIFSEDDFLFCGGQPHAWNVKGNPSLGDVMPRVTFASVLKDDIISLGKNILSNNKDIKHVQFTRNVHYDPKVKTSEFLNLFLRDVELWHVLDHSKMPRYYYTNWPYMMRTKDLIPLKKGQNIAQVEASQGMLFNRTFGGGDWAVCPRRPYYIHVGRGISTQKGISKGGRIVVNYQIQECVLGGVVTRDVHKFARMLTKWFIKDQFYVTADSVLRLGLNKAFKEALGTY